MSRLLDVDLSAEPLHAPLRLEVGDQLLLRATGTRLRSGAEVVDLSPPLTWCTIGVDGQVVCPAGSPNAIIARVVGPGRAIVDVIIGDPWYRTEVHPLTIAVGE